MSDTAQIFLTIIIITNVLMALFWALEDKLSMVIFNMGLALLVGMVIF